MSIAKGIVTFETPVPVAGVADGTPRPPARYKPIGVRAEHVVLVELGPGEDHCSLTCVTGKSVTVRGSYDTVYDALLGMAGTPAAD